MTADDPQPANKLRIWPEPAETSPTPAEQAMTPSTPTKSSGESKPKRVEVNPYHFWNARFWHGMTFGTWTKLVAQNQFRIGPTKLGLASTVTFASLMNSALRPLQQLLLGKHLERMQIKDSPIFIIGHWRSGTTLLHELMVLDGPEILTDDVVVRALRSTVRRQDPSPESLLGGYGHRLVG